MVEFLVAAVVAASPPPQQQQLDTTLAVRAGGRIEVENPRGPVIVRAWERDEVRVRARYPADTRIELARTGSEIRVESEGRRGRPGQVDYEITVPRSFAARIEGMNSSIQVDGVEGGLDIETVNGSITLTGVAGRIRAESVHGRITIRGSRGSLAAESTNQGIEVTDHSGDIAVETVNGAIALSNVRAGTVHAETVNGNLQYQGDFRDGGRYEFSTHNGNITLVLPASTGAQFSVETFNGEIDSEFPIQLLGRARREMTFTLGGGGARVELATFSGTVRLRRAPR